MNKTGIRYKAFVMIFEMMSLYIIIMVIIFMIEPNHRITLSSFNEITIGMDKNKVIDILGCPPGNYQTRPKLVGFTKFHDPSREEEWWADTDYIVVGFDNENKVIDKGHLDLSKMDYTPINRNNLLEEIQLFIQCRFL